jgi:hypothetical protein
MGNEQLDRMIAREAYNRLRQADQESLVMFNERYDRIIRTIQGYGIDARMMQTSRLLILSTCSTQFAIHNLKFTLQIILPLTVLMSILIRIIWLLNTTPLDTRSLSLLVQLVVRILLMVLSPRSLPIVSVRTITSVPIIITKTTTRRITASSWCCAGSGRWW